MQTAGHDQRFVKALRVRAKLGAKPGMPFADMGCVIPAIAQHFRDRHLCAGQALILIWWHAFGGVSVKNGAGHASLTPHRGAKRGDHLAHAIGRWREFKARARGVSASHDHRA